MQAILLSSTLTLLVLGNITFCNFCCNFCCFFDLLLAALCVCVVTGPSRTLCWRRLESILNLMCCRLCRLLGYSHYELVGKSLFSFHHALDAEMLDKAFRSRELIHCFTRHSAANLELLLLLLLLLLSSSSYCNTFSVKSYIWCCYYYLLGSFFIKKLKGSFL